MNISGVTPHRDPRASLGRRLSPRQRSSAVAFWTWKWDAATYEKDASFAGEPAVRDNRDRLSQEPTAKQSQERIPAKSSPRRQHPGHLSDAWIFNESQQHLRVLFTYEGKNPGQTYSEKATLRAAEQGPDIQGKLTQQSLWAPVTSSNRLQLLWMFPDFPKDTPQIFLRLDFTERKSTQIVKSLEFAIPGSGALPKRKLNQGG